MNAKWTTERRFVPVHLTSGNHATSFSTQQQPESTKSSFASEDVAVVVPVGADPPPTASLRLTRNLGAEEPSADLSLVQQEKPGGAGYPVIVFGAPADHHQQVVDHFRQFGELEVSANQNIECGRNYLRVVYAEEAAALRALRENGKLGPGGFMLGCVGDHDTPRPAGPSREVPVKIAVQAPAESLFCQENKGETFFHRVLNGVSTAVFGISDL